MFNSICDIVSQEDIYMYLKNKGINCFWKNVVNFVLLVCNKIIIYDT